MKAISVQLRKSTPQGRLHPAYDTEAELLSVGSRLVRPWPVGVNVDGRVILDADSERVLANFDLLIPQRLWRIGNQPSLPQQHKEADIVLSESSVSQKNFSLKLTVTTNIEKSWVYICIGDTQTGDKWIKLSDYCFAELSSSYLVGFYVLL